jgi:uncharacterized protein YdaU (DUF1376 family)
MHYYSFNIGDYAGHTRHLSLLEDLAYRRLLDAYYLAERPLNGSTTDIARMIGMRDHSEEVAYVLNQFFSRESDIWINKRADQEIAHVKRKSELASIAGKASAERRLNGRSTSVKKRSTSAAKTSTDVQPHNTQYTIHNTPIVPSGDEMFERFWSAYPKKVGKDAARKRFEQRKPDVDMLDLMLGAIARQATTDQWVREGGQYIPNPATWLSQGRWMDGELETAPVLAFV